MQHDRGQSSHSHQRLPVRKRYCWFVNSITCALPRKHTAARFGSNTRAFVDRSARISYLATYGNSAVDEQRPRDATVRIEARPTTRNWAPCANASGLQRSSDKQMTRDARVHGPVASLSRRRAQFHRSLLLSVSAAALAALLPRSAAAQERGPAPPATTGRSVRTGAPERFRPAGSGHHHGVQLRTRQSLA